jgi:hypothetical protein
MRGEFKVNARGRRVEWLDAFADDFATTIKGRSAVDVARERSQQSIHEQITSIVNNTAHTVDSKVKEMQDRTGLTERLKRIASNGKKEDAIFSNFGPKMQQDLLSFCKNRISAYRGQTTVPALQYDLLSTFKQHGLQSQDVNTEDVARWISGLIAAELKMNPPSDTSDADLGLVDSDQEDENENVDFFKGIMPAG